jgi:hypothetical protein
MLTLRAHIAHISYTERLISWIHLPTASLDIKRYNLMYRFKINVKYLAIIRNKKMLHCTHFIYREADDVNLSAKL